MKRIREIFWPLLDEAKPESKEEYTVEDIKVNGENIERVLDYTQKAFEEELKRSTSVETKSSLFIGTFSVVTSVVLAITTTLINNNDFSILLFSTILLLFSLIVYMIRTIWFSIKVLERRGFHIMHHTDYNIEDKREDFTKKLIAQLITKTHENYKIGNSKVNNMAMAQAYFKRALIVLLLYSVILVVFFIEKEYPQLRVCASKAVSILNQISIRNWLFWTCISVLIVSVFFNVYLFKKLKGRKRLKD